MMGITQALKLQEGPIDALARLPQQELIQMAQQGRIGADILPIILNEKAQMAKQVANMQAAQQPRPPSVIEQAMATNAQAEAQAQPQMPTQAPPQMPTQMAQAQPRESGIANLPIPNNTFSDGGETGYAGGGIVAFSDGGLSLSDLVNTQMREDPYSGYQPTSTAGLSDFIRQAQGISGGLPGRAALEKLLADESRYQAEERTRSAKDREENKWLRLAEAGMGIMGGESPYAFANIGKGSQAALKGYAEDLKEQRKQEQAARQARLAMAKQQYELEAGDVASGLGLFKEAKAEERTAADRESREKIAALDRENRLAIANIPDKALQVAAQLRKDDPNLSYLDAISQASQALSPKDTYNATRTAVSAAAKDANAEFMQRATFDSKLQEDMRKAAAGDAAAQARVKAIKDKIQEDTFKTYQVQGVDLSGGRMGTPNANDPLGIRR